MIVVVIGGMVLHNLIVFRKKLILHRIGQPRILFRMTLAQRIQHLALLTSFFTLVLTGFALKYPSSWLAMVFVNEAVRSIVHRVAGVVLIVVSLFHIWYVSTNPDGRQLIKDMLPDWKDVTDVREAFLLLPGVQRTAPAVPPLHLCREGRVLGVGLGHVRHGQNRTDGLVQGRGG